MNTESQKIEQIIEKYLNAETSIQEEALLKNYFTSDKVAPHLMHYQGMFIYFSKNRTEKASKSLRLKTGNRRRLLIGGMALQNYYEQKQAEKALADTKMALELIAKQLNKGNKAIQELENVEKTKNKAFRTELSITK
jgi:hypothetical protein